MVSLAGEALVVVLGGVLGRFAPSLGLGAVLLSVPLRAPLFEDVNVATLLLVGTALGRSAAIGRTLREEPLFFVTTAAFPLWVLASVAWARQPLFVWGLLWKWTVVLLSAWLAASDRTREPRAVVAAVVLASAPHAAWALLERLHVVRPLGDPEILRFRTIEFMGRVRGRAMFYHPNRLGEFAEQLGLVLAGAGLYGLWPKLCLGSLLVVAAGIWGTGSIGAMAGLAAGLVLLATWVVAERGGVGLRRGHWLAAGAAALVGAVAVGGWALWAHGGIGTRSMVYEFALRTIAENPVLGSGAGNWPLLVGEQGPSLDRLWFGRHAHSLLLHVGAELGAIGMVLVTAFFVGPLWSGLPRVAEAPSSWRGIGLGAAAGAVALFAHDLVHYFLREAADGIVTGLVLGTVVAVARRPRRTDAASSPAGDGEGARAEEVRRPEEPR